MTVCNLCHGEGIAKECPKCRFDPDEMCDTCDGEGFIDCPYIDKEWHS